MRLGTTIELLNSSCSVQCRFQISSYYTRLRLDAAFTG